MSERAQALEAALRRLAQATRDTLTSHKAELGCCTVTTARLFEAEQLLEQLALAAPPVGVSPQPGDSPPDMGHGWFVTVGRSGDSVVTIEEKCLSGKPDFTPQDDALIRGAARHLLAFIGSPASLSPVELTPEPPPDAQVCVWRATSVLPNPTFRAECVGGDVSVWLSAADLARRKVCRYCGKRLVVGTAPQGGEQ